MAWKRIEPALETDVVGEEDEERIVARQRALPARCRLDSSMAWAMTLAVPGVPVSTSVSPLRPTVIGDVGEDPLEPVVRRDGAVRRRDDLGQRRRRGRRRRAP